MDASKNAGPFFSTRLNDKLPTCGDQCCPFGYACAKQGDTNICVLDKSKAGPATTTKVTSTASATVTSSPTSVSSGINSNDPPPVKETNNFPVGVFFAGFFPGIVVGVLSALAWVVLTKRHTKAPNTRGLNMDGNGGRPYISNPIQNAQHSNERSDFLSRTRSRAKSMFSTHRRSRTVDSIDFWNAKMPTPPPNNNVPINYVNDMPDVPVTPARRVARYPSEENFSRAIPDHEKEDYSPVSPPSAVSDPNRPETIRIYSPDLVQNQQSNTQPMPIMPLAAVPPLRGMNTQRRISPPYGIGPIEPQRPRRDSGTGLERFGSPFQTPEKKPEIQRNNTPSLHATYHDVATLHSPESPQQQGPQTLTPARYNPYAAATLAPSAAALAAAARLSKAHQALPSQQRNQPLVPPRPQNQNQGEPTKARPETALSDFDFDEGLHPNYVVNPSDSDSSLFPVQPISPPRDAYKSQALGNPYAYNESSTTQRADPSSTFDNMPGATLDPKRKDKHATNGTSFTSMLRSIDFPDPLKASGNVPAVPKLNLAKVNGGKKAKGKKGMI